VQYSCLWIITKGPQRPHIHIGWLCARDCTTAAQGIFCRQGTHKHTKL